MDNAVGLRVQVCFAAPDMQILRDLIVPEGTTLQQAVEQSGVMIPITAAGWQISAMGIYGKVKTPDTVLRDHDRVELYRPLIADPKETRRWRAKKMEHSR